MEIIALMFIALTASFLLGELFYKLKMPKVLGPIILGLIFAQKPLIGLISTGGTIEIFNFIKDIAIIFLMFFVGLKIDLRDFKKTSKRSFLVGLFASLIPFLLGFLAVVLISKTGIFASFVSGSNIFLVAIVVGICLSITAEGVIIELLEELNLIKSTIGETVIEAGIIDDILGILLISGLIAFIPGTSQSGEIGFVVLRKILDMALFAGVIFIIGYFIVPKIMKLVEKEKSTINFFAVSVMIILFLAMVTQFLDLGGSILGSLFGGIIIRHTLLSGDKYEQKEEKSITDVIEVTTFGFFAPFFFIWIGLNVNLSILFEAPLITLLFVALGISGKMIGSLLGNRLARGRMWEGFIIGWGMNIRSGVDIMIATLALTAGIISIDLFSVLIFMSFATTVISPIVFERLVKKHHGL